MSHDGCWSCDGTNAHLRRCSDGFGVMWRWRVGKKNSGMGDGCRSIGLYRSRKELRLNEVH